MPVTLTLQQTLTVCRHFESLKMHIKQIRCTKSINYLQKIQQKSKKKSDQADWGQPKGKQSFLPKTNPNPNQVQQNKCPRCGHNFHYGSERCPASNVECHFCHKTGHFSNLCYKCHWQQQQQQQASVNELNNQTIPKSLQVNRHGEKKWMWLIYLVCTIIMTRIMLI